MVRSQVKINDYCHIYNRGVEKRDVFLDDYDYVRFIRSIREFNCVKPVGSLYSKEKYEKSGSTALKAVEPLSKLVDIICYSLLPNHYHLLLMQLSSNGISEFIKRLSGGYTCYFNNKYNRTGALFQGKYKYEIVKSDSYLLTLTCYVNGNSEIHKLCKADKWIWSSYLDYLNLRNGTLCNKCSILKDFNSIEEYKKLINQFIAESKERKSFKKY
jgi:putative transposase